MSDTTLVDRVLRETAQLVSLVEKAGPAADRVLLSVAPKWALERMRARALATTLARHYEAAQGGRRTTGWPRSSADANAAAGPALATLRDQARDLVRNNAWARRAKRTITNNTVGWGITPKAIGGNKKLAAAWKRWAGTTDCDADGQHTFAGLQTLALKTVAESGEVLVRRRLRRPADGLTIPLALQVLEPDFLDTAKDGLIGQQGGPIVQGVEFDAIGRRTAYWLYDQHPGSGRLGTITSRRVPADNVCHVFYSERPGQVRGVSWYSVAIVKLRDFDEYEDATLLRQKIAACFAAFVTDVDGAGSPLGEPSKDDKLVEMIEPGLISKLPPGRNVTFANPPLTGEDGFSPRTLRWIASGIGVTYEDMTGDYSQVNFSSARMARLAHWGNVHDWRWNMLMPQLCDPLWRWAMEAAALVGLIEDPAEVLAEWTPPPMPMLEPDREGLALARLVRAGAMTPSEMVRQQGEDPEAHWQEYGEDMARLDAAGIWLDSDVRRVSQAGLTQARAGAVGTDGEEAPPAAPAKNGKNGAARGNGVVSRPE
jgi:lambda family phage portal protein